MVYLYVETFSAAEIEAAFRDKVSLHLQVSGVHAEAVLEGFIHKLRLGREGVMATLSVADSCVTIANGGANEDVRCVCGGYNRGRFDQGVCGDRRVPGGCTD